MHPAPRTLLTLGLAAAAVSSAVAGVIDVSFIEPARFTDAGATPWERQSRLNDLAGHLKALGQRLLSPDQTLKIEVLDVDLAGEPRPSAHAGRDLRIVRGGADWPRIQLRYTLTADGKPLLSGEETVADLNYTQGLDSGRNTEPLYYEKRMLDRWFKVRLVERRAD
jgi:hypothetical protein